MGGTCCRPPNLDPPAPATFQNGVGQLTANSLASEITEVANLMAQSFTGSVGTRPEAVISWALDWDTENRDTPGDHYSPLTAAPKDNDLDSMQWFMTMALDCNLRHGGVFTLRDASGKLVAATICIAPTAKPLHEGTFCEFLGFLARVPHGLSVFPRMMTAKNDAVGKVMKTAKAAHASDPHVYVYTFATAVDEQRKGYGSQLMRHVTAWADQLGVPAYLETSGIGNTKFYARCGFKIAQTYTITSGSDSFDEFYAMLRPPSGPGTMRDSTDTAAVADVAEKSNGDCSAVATRSAKVAPEGAAAN
jgi:GNAT superfamily N-acetyltransferase